MGLRTEIARWIGARVGPSIPAVDPPTTRRLSSIKTVRHVADVLGGLVADFEIVVTNDGSRDRTADILARLSTQEPALRLRVVTHQTNQGYGAALASAFDAAYKDFIFMTDGDKQFDVTELATFLPHWTKALTSSLAGEATRADPAIRLLNAWGWKVLVNGLFGYTARDVDCAFKLFRRTVWERVTVHAHGATFSAEFLIKARRLGFGIKELPVSHLPRTAGSPTGARPQVILRALWELSSLWWDLSYQRVEHGRARPAPSVPGRAR